MRLNKQISIPEMVAELPASIRWRSNFIARVTRLSGAAGNAILLPTAQQDDKVISSSRRNLNVNVSYSAIGTINISNSWKPSGRLSVISKKRLSLAGANTSNSLFCRRKNITPQTRSATSPETTKRSSSAMNPSAHCWKELDDLLWKKKVCVSSRRQTNYFPEPAVHLR